MSRATIDQARAAKAGAAALFSKLARVAGVGIVRCDEGYGVKINLAAPLPANAAAPATINGVPIRVEVIGAIRKR